MTNVGLEWKTTTKHGIACGLIVLVVLVGSWLLHGDLRASSEYSLPMDHHKYLAMAEGSLGEFRIAPFCWRIAVPAIAGQMGPLVDPFGAFLLIGAICVVWTGVLIGNEVLDATGSRSVSIAAVLLYTSLGWITRGFVYYGASVDPCAILIGLLVYRAARRLDYGSMIACGFIGALVKESILISVLAALIAYGRHFTWWKNITALAVPAGVLFAIRLLIPSGNSDPTYIASIPQAQALVQYGSSDYNLGYLINVVLPTRFSSFSLADLNAMTFDAFGVGLVLLWVLLARTNWPVFVKAALVVLLSWSQVLVAANIQRPVLLVAPVIICMSFSGLSQVRPRSIELGIVVLSLLVTCMTVESRISPSVLLQSLCWGVFFALRYVYSILRVGR